MNNTKSKKLTGKELAKINKRKKFYDKLENLYNRVEEGKEQVIFLTMNKKNSFPEFDGLSKILTNNFVELDKEIEMKGSRTIEIVYFEEAQFLLDASKSEILKIYRRETKFNTEGELRKGSGSEDGDYNYQAAFNWAIGIQKNEKLTETLAKERVNPTEYDLTPAKAVILDPFHYRSKKQPRRKRR